MWKYIDNLFMKAAIFLEHAFPYIKDDHSLSSNQKYHENLEHYYDDDYLDDLNDPCNPIGFTNMGSPNYIFGDD